MKDLLADEPPDLPLCGYRPQGDTSANNRNFRHAANGGSMSSDASSSARSSVKLKDICIGWAIL